MKRFGQLLPILKSRLLNLFNSPLISRKHYSSMGDHSQITKTNFRQNVLSDATVIEMNTLSPSVIGMKLHVDDKNVTFLAGQWIDLFIPNVNQVGGFSMYSPPCLLKELQEIHLAVKKSSWPPAKWVHTNCRVGDRVQIRIGGDFFYQPTLNYQTPDLIFIAGGVGINPLLSMMLQLKNSFEASASKKNFPESITLLYSAKVFEEILFQEAISELADVLSESFKYEYFVTRPPCETQMSQNFKRKRMTEEDLRMALNRSKQQNNLICFICGPPPMTDHFRSQLINMGVKPQQIKSEKWW